MNGFLVVVVAMAAWVGWGLIFSACANAFRLMWPDVNKQAVLRSAAIQGVVGVVFLALDAGFNKKPAGGWSLPLVWVSAPIAAYLAGFALVLGLIQAVMAFLALSPEDRQSRLRNMGGLAALAAVLGYLFFDEWNRAADKEAVVKVFTGAIPFSLQNFAILVLALLACVAVMVWADRSVRARGHSKTLASHVALILGSLVFALPFAFLVITSFKEDRDMSSPDGIVWVPKVQQTMPFFDPKNPLFEGTYQGQRIQGTIIAQDGENVRVDIFKPMSIRGKTFATSKADLKEIPRDAPLVAVEYGGSKAKGMVIEDLEDGRKRVQLLEPAAAKGKTEVYEPAQTDPIRETGLRWQNYPEAIDFFPPETMKGLLYVRNTLILVVLSVVGTILSSAIVAYAFSRMQFPGRNFLFALMLSTMMLPGAVTLLPQFLIFRGLGWIDTLQPLWVPAFFGSAFNVFMLRQFFMGIPMELEDAAKIDGCGYLKTFWSVMMPQIKPALAVIAIWTFMGAWNNFMGPLIYINSPELMPLSYALQLFQGDRSGEPGLLMAVTTLSILPVLTLFAFCQRYFIEGVQLSGLGGR